MEDVKITVLMCVYNGEEYLKESVDSILRQTYKEFEFLIIDDCSTDDTLKVLNSYEDPRITLFVNDENIGLTKSLNKGLLLARGGYIARMDADDISAVNRLQTQLDIMESNKDITLIYGNTDFIDVNSEKICSSYRPKSVDKVLKNLEINNFIPHPTVMFVKSDIISVGGYDERLNVAQDLDLWIRLRDNGFCFKYLNAKLLNYRLNPDTVRNGAYENYWFTVCKYCITHYSKKSVAKYFFKLTIFQMLKIAFRIMIPSKIYWHRLI